MRPPSRRASAQPAASAASARHGGDRRGGRERGISSAARGAAASGAGSGTGRQERRTGVIACGVMVGGVMAGDVIAGRVMAGDVIAGRVMAGDVIAGRVMAGDVIAGRVMVGGAEGVTMQCMWRGGSRGAGAAASGAGAAASGAGKRRCGQKKVRVVAVSKTKPVSLLREVYDAGQRHFGENYVQEILDKAPQLPPDTKWHFIGHLQSNKAKSLVSGVPSLYMVETVDSSRIANHLNKAVAAAGRPPLRVLVQVNTSGEESKHGVDPSACVDLVRHVTSECPNLCFSGLMTIGMPDYSSRPENFKALARCRAEVCEQLGLTPSELELSMGMSNDFEQA
ncbi:unnamed protein product, partial [Closterium sp. Naga37s-1]